MNPARSHMTGSKSPRKRETRDAALSQVGEWGAEEGGSTCKQTTYVFYRISGCRCAHSNSSSVFWDRTSSKIASHHLQGGETAGQARFPGCSTHIPYSKGVDSKDSSWGPGQAIGLHAQRLPSQWTSLSGGPVAPKQTTGVGGLGPGTQHLRSLSNLGSVAPLAASSGSTVSKKIVQGFSLSLSSII